VWKYRTRPGEEASRITVLKVESDLKLGTIVHIAIDGVTIRNPSNPAEPSRTIGHLPFQEKALTESVTTQDGTHAGAPDLEGYHTWKEAFDRSEAGIWTVPVAEAVGAMETALNK
jgi:hypothetical protein